MCTCSLHRPGSQHEHIHGAFARTGVEVFTLVDTHTWYVVANFRETQLRHIPSGAPADLYLHSQPGRHFRGTVVGLGWAVLPENGTSVNGLPRGRAVPRLDPARRALSRAYKGGKSGRLLSPRRLGGRDGARHLAHSWPMNPLALLDFLRRELAPTPGRGGATFRLTLACLATTIPLLTHHVPHALVALIIMYLITQEDTAATLIGSILGWVAVTIALGVALLAWKISLDIAVAAILSHSCIPLRGSVPQVVSKRSSGWAPPSAVPLGPSLIIPDLFPPSRSK